MIASASDIARAGNPPEATMLRTLDLSLDIMAKSDCPYLVIGEVASAVWGRDRGTADIDLFVRPETVPTVLSNFEAAGFETVVKNEHWLYKAVCEQVEVDVIFRASRDILLDDEMMGRSVIADFRGREVRVAPAEDLVVMKAVAANEDTARYWYDALAIISRSPLDWSYLVRRSQQHGGRKMLSLLLFATSIDLVVPDQPIRELLSALALRGVAGRG